MSNSSAQQIWEQVLADTCDCHAEPITGNRLCDNGSPCTRCSADWIDEEYKCRLAKACEQHGHQWKATSDCENGTETLDCERCGARHVARF